MAAAGSVAAVTVAAGAVGEAGDAAAVVDVAVGVVEGVLEVGVEGGGAADDGDDFGAAADGAAGAPVIADRPDQIR